MGEAEAGEDGVDLVVEVVAAAPLEALGEVAVLFEGGVELLALGVGERGFELAEALLDASEAADGVEDELVDGEGGGLGRLLLGQVADLDAAGGGDSAAVGWGARR